MKRILAMVSVTLALLFCIGIPAFAASSGTDANSSSDITSSENDVSIDAKLYVESYEKSIFQAGDVQNMPMTIGSRMGGYATNIRFTIAGSGDYADKFNLDDPTGWYRIGELNEHIHAVPTLRVSSDVPDGRYKLYVTFQYDDVNSNTFTSTDEIMITVAGRSSDTPYIQSAALTKSKIGKENKSPLKLSIKNPMSAAIWNVNVAFQPKGSENFSLYGNQMPVKISSINAGKAAAATFSVYVPSSVLTGNYPITFSISYKEAGQTVNTLTQTVYVQVVRTADIDNNSKEKVNSQPRIIISGYTTSANPIQAGKDFVLGFTLQNTNAKSEVSNVKVVLGSDDTPADKTSAGTAPSAGGAAGSSVFFPAEGNNSFYIDKIGPKQSVSKSIHLMTSQDVEPGVYAVTLTIDYDGGTGGPWESKEQLSFPVNQEQRLAVQGLTVPTDAAVGDEIPLQFQYINKGKTVIYNFSVSVEGGFTLEGGDNYVGNLSAGNNDTFEGTLQAKAEGEQKGTLVLKYENSKGEQKEEKKEFTVNVSAAGAENGAADVPTNGTVTKPKKGMSPIIWWCVGGAAVAAAIVVPLLIHKRRKAKKEKEDDEED